MSNETDQEQFVLKDIGNTLHERLHTVCRHLPTDFEPYGKQVRTAADPTTAPSIWPAVCPSRPCPQTPWTAVSLIPSMRRARRNCRPSTTDCMARISPIKVITYAGCASVLLSGSASLFRHSLLEPAAIPMKAVEAREGLVLATTELGDLPLAEEQLEAIASTLSGLGNDERAAFAFYRLGLVQEELNKPRAAEASYEAAHSLYSSLGMLDDPRAKEITERLGRIRTQVTG